MNSKRVTANIMKTVSLISVREKQTFLLPVSEVTITICG